MEAPRKLATWESLGYWVWLWIQRRDVTPWIVEALHANGVDEDRVSKFAITTLVTGESPKQHQVVLQTMLQLKQNEDPELSLKDQIVPFSEQVLLDLLREAEDQITKGTVTTSIQIDQAPSKRQHAYRRPYRITDALPRQSINPAPKKQVRLRNEPYSCYVRK